MQVPRSPFFNFHSRKIDTIISNTSCARDGHSSWHSGSMEAEITLEERRALSGDVERLSSTRSIFFRVLDLPLESSLTSSERYGAFNVIITEARHG